MKNKDQSHKHLWSRGQDNGLLPDGRYIYVPVEGKPIFLTPGEDGVTEEDILILSTMDYEDSKKRDYDRKKRDYTIEYKKCRESSETSDINTDPIDNLPDPHGDVFSLLFPEEQEQDPRLILLHQFIDQLQPQQIDLLYSLYGELQQMTEIARREGITKYAIYNREQKILKRIKKMFTDAGFPLDKD